MGITFHFHIPAGLLWFLAGLVAGAITTIVVEWMMIRIKDGDTSEEDSQ